MRTTSEVTALHRNQSLVPLGNNYIIRPAYVGDAFTVLDDLRKEDRVEWAASVEGGVEKLAESIAASAECYAVADIDDVAHIIFGVVREPEPTVWLLGTNQGQRDCAWILHECREFYTEFFKRWPHTVCYSDPNNEAHHRWLKWMGFEFTRRCEWGPYRAKFLEFRKEV